MIKKILLSLGLLTIGLINYCNAEVGPWNGIGIPGQTFTSTRRDTVDLYVSDNLDFSGTFDGITKDIFIVYARQFFYWNTRGEMSAYSSNRENSWNNRRGGKLTYYYKCDSFNVPFSGFTNCTQFTYTGSEIQNVNNLLGRRNEDDDIVYGSATIGSTVNDTSYSPFIGFNIPNENISIVFYFKCPNGADIGYGLPYVYNQSYGIDFEYGGDYNSRNRPNIYAGSSPVILGGGGDIVSSNIDYKCTKETALKWYEKNGYSSKLCYGGFNNFNLFTGVVNDLPFYGSGLDIEEIWFNSAQYRIYGDTGSGMGYDDWFHYWRLVYNSYYRTINQGGVMNNPFNNTPLVLFTYFSAVNQFGKNLKDKDILEYCDLKLYTVDYSAVYSGNYGNRVCSPLVWLEESINNYSNSSGNVNVGVNIGSGSNGSGNSGQNFTDGTSFIQSFVQFIDSDKFKGTNTGSNGIIPGYIVLVLCALLLFRFLMH